MCPHFLLDACDAVSSTSSILLISLRSWSGLTSWMRSYWKRQRPWQWNVRAFIGWGQSRTLCCHFATSRASASEGRSVIHTPCWNTPCQLCGRCQVQICQTTPGHIGHHHLYFRNGICVASASVGAMQHGNLAGLWGFTCTSLVVEGTIFFLHCLKSSVLLR